MLAGSVSFAVPGVMPEAAAANQYLWVSVEDSGNSKFYGGQVVEIVVTDPAINRLDEAYGMPDVTIDGKKVIMAQGVDGSWYAYIADGKKATGIDVKYAESLFGSGADYGTWCAPGTDLEYAPGTGTSGARSVSVPNLVASESRGVSIPYLTHIGVGNSTFSGYSQGTGITAVCDTAATDGVNRMGDDLYNSQKMSFNATSPAHVLNAGATGINNTDNAMNNVVREARALSNGTGDYYGNIGLGPNF
jgi:hypothetical protein